MSGPSNPLTGSSGPPDVDIGRYSFGMGLSSERPIVTVFAARPTMVRHGPLLL
jgi:hypothetical protein